MLVPKLKVGTFVKVDCNPFKGITDLLRTGEIKKVNEDGTYDIQIGKVVYPSCEPTNIIAYAFSIEEIISGSRVRIRDNREAKVIRKVSDISLSYDLELDGQQFNNVHYDYFDPIYKEFSIGDRVFYKEKQAKIIAKHSDLYYELEMDSNQLIVPEFDLIKDKDYNRNRLFKWLRKLI